MGYARYIGRVGALAVTLGVGMAMASTPGIAYADPSAGASTSSGDSSSTSASDSSSAPSSASSSSSKKSSAGTDGASTDASARTDSPASDRKPATQQADESTADSEDADDVADDVTPDTAAADYDTADDDDTAPVASDDDTPPADTTQAEDDRSLKTPANGDSAHQRVVSRSANVHRSARAATTDVDSRVTATDEVEPERQTVSVAAVADPPARQSFARSSAQARMTSATTLTSAVPAPSVPQQPKTVLNLVSDFVAAVLQPLLGPVRGTPIQIPILTAALSLVRNEFERIFAPRKANVASQQNVSLLTDPSPSVDSSTQHVLVIGVDGTNLSRILADPANDNFLELMGTSTTAAASIVGHTTISNPSWTAILTGVWGERTGVINNVFTPWTYDRFPTLFNQLEALPSDVDTTAIGDWDVINAIAGAGSDGADQNLYVPQLEGDKNWLATDDRVADLTIGAIEDTDAQAPSFLFAYYVGVDENGHMYGGASPEYAAAIENMDDNLGKIMDTVALRETTMNEDWTIIVVTDHGHQPQQGFGHGFQSPDETATFVIADGPDFKDGYINQAYEIVDTTPTVVSLFGGTPRPGSDGVPLQSLGDGFLPVDLKQALEEAIAQNKSPDLLTNVALSLRTIVATVPYYIYTFGNDTSAGLPSFLLLPVKIVFDGLYVATNIPAQIVAFLTGVSGARIFPLLPPAPPAFPPAEEATLPDAAIFVRCGVSGSVAESWCGEASVA
ncbi:MAG TPA: alkaline phosphatase family protein [Mycobacterium sp.]